MIARRRRSCVRGPVGAVVALALALGTCRASAQEKLACVEAHVQAQELRRDGKLRAALQRLEACVSETCPAPVREDCAAWAGEVANALPSVVLEARDRTGRQMREVEVFVDGERMVTTLTGRSLALDPGEHHLRFRVRGAPDVLRSIVLNEGERLRRVAVDFPPVDGPRPAPTPGHQPSPLLFVSAVAAVVGLAGFATFAALGNDKEAELEECATACPPSRLDDYDSMRLNYALADISLGVAALGIGGTILFAVWPADSPPPPTTSQPSPWGVSYRARF